MSRRARWFRWLAIWSTLIVGLGFLFVTMLGPLAPPHLPWSGAFILGSALTFFLVPTPAEDD